jgi:hypothetical protein
MNIPLYTSDSERLRSATGTQLQATAAKAAGKKPNQCCNI